MVSERAPPRSRQLSNRFRHAAGRSIKNVVRTAQALALSKGIPLSSKELDIVIKASETFAKDFKDADHDGVYDAPGEGWQDRTMAYN